MSQDNEIDRLRRLFSLDPFASGLGVEIVEMRPGYAKVKMTVDESHLNFNGFVHGGMIFTLMDQAFAAAGNSHGDSSVAVSMDVQFVNAAKPSGTLYAEAKEVERSRKLGLYEMKVWDAEEKLVCKSNGRVYIIGKPILEEGGGKR
ncbi:MAG: PaaI family thioesterase [Proteobacteria bacterium]|nr:PaaI family thioesterase [Pseudomonadota bacterium]